MVHGLLWVTATKAVTLMGMDIDKFNVIERTSIGGSLQLVIVELQAGTFSDTSGNLIDAFKIQYMDLGLSEIYGAKVLLDETNRPTLANCNDGSNGAVTVNIASRVFYDNNAAPWASIGEITNGGSGYTPGTNAPNRGAESSAKTDGSGPFIFNPLITADASGVVTNVFVNTASPTSSRGSGFTDGDSIYVNQAGGTAGVATGHNAIATIKVHKGGPELTIINSCSATATANHNTSTATLMLIGRKG